MLPPALALAIDPSAGYVRLAREDTVSWLTALGGPALSALVIGAAVAMIGTDGVTLPLVASTTLMWSIAPAVQLGAAAVLVISVSARTVSVARGVDLLFMGHAPWSLWLLGVAAMTLLSGASAKSVPMLVSAVLPAALTARVILAFCRVVLQLDRRSALRRTIAHQAFIWIVVLFYVSVTMQLWPRLVAFAGR
jgi:hypothetical protein